MKMTLKSIGMLLMIAMAGAPSAYGDVDRGADDGLFPGHPGHGPIMRPGPGPRPGPHPGPRPMPPPPQPRPYPQPAPRPYPRPRPYPHPAPRPYPHPRPYPRPHPRPYPQPAPVPQPSSYLCSGTFVGTFSNGVQAMIMINGYQATVVAGQSVAFNGNFYCEEYGNQAQVSYEVSNPSIGSVYGEGSITLGGDGRAYLSIQQNNGLTVNAVR